MTDLVSARRRALESSVPAEIHAQPVDLTFTKSASAAHVGFTAPYQRSG